MRRKKESSLQNLTIRLPPSDIEWLNQKADTEDRSVSAIIRLMVKKERATSGGATAPANHDADQASP
jgi:hypothetical protein